MRLEQLIISSALAGAILVWGGEDSRAEVHGSSLQTPAAKAVNFRGDILPIFQARCFKCHGQGKSKGGLRLDSRTAALKGGNEGVAIIPGKSAQSPLIHFVTHQVEDMEMPPIGKGERLTAGEVALLRAWIDQGAQWSEAEADSKPSVASPEKRQPTERQTGPGESVNTSSLDLSGLPPAATKPVDFDRDILPILQENCLKCHGPEKPKGRFRLDNRLSALRGGNEGVDIIPGDSANSPLIYFVAHLVDEMEMPPDGEPLSRPDVALLRAWIDQGAEWGAASATQRLHFSLTPTLRWISVKGNKQKFRELTGLREEKWTWGVERFSMEAWFDQDTKFTIEGRGITGPEDYRLKFNLERQDVGFLRGGFEHVRRYYNNYGGYYEPFASLPEPPAPLLPIFPPPPPGPVVVPPRGPAFMLDRDLHMDVGRYWTEIGINPPRWPSITLGYEYRFKEGEKSTLHWGPSTQGGVAPFPGGPLLGGDTRFIYPSYKMIQEDVHIFRADVSYDLYGFEMENNFMAEYTDLKIHRFEAGTFNFGSFPNSFNSVSETYDSVQMANTFNLQKEITDWWLVSGGHYYSKLDADATFQQNTVDMLGQSVLGQHWFSRPIVLDWESHMFNTSTRLGPWKGLTLSGGFQGNWEEQEAIGNSTLFFGIPDPTMEILPIFSSTVNSNKQTVRSTEHATLRYDRIPYTALYAQVELEQESTDFFEQDPGLLQNFLRDTDSRSNERDYRTGFTLGPWRTASLNAHYRYREKEDRYTHLRDEIAVGPPELMLPSVPNLGYSAFILGRDMETHEFKTRFKFRPTTWLRTMVTYQLRDTDYLTRTAPNIDPNRDPLTAFVLPSDTLGGEVFAGEHSTNTYSLNLIFNPWKSVTFNSTFSYNDSRTRTFDNGDFAVADFDGDVYSGMINASIKINKKTDFTAGYSYSHGDFTQDFSRTILKQNGFPLNGQPPLPPPAPAPVEETKVSGLPLGSVYQQHNLQLGISRQITDNMRASLQYVLSRYDEENSGNINDFVAHGVFASIGWDW